MPSLRRISDGRGDSGRMSDILRMGENGEPEILHSEKPRVGWKIMVGSWRAGTYTTQDWWLTTTVTEILEETENYVKFKTGNSEYEWKSN